MKLWAAFDTRYKATIIREMLLSYDSNDILVLSRAFSHRLITCYIPFTVALIVLIGISSMIFSQLTGDALLVAMSISGICLLGLSCYAWYRYYLLHELDFIVITSDMVHIYDQLNLFNRTCKVIYVSNITGIYVNKKWFLNSLLDQWNITIDETWVETINRLSFWPIKHPDHIRERLEVMVAAVNTK